MSEDGKQYNKNQDVIKEGLESRSIYKDLMNANLLGLFCPLFRETENNYIRLTFQSGETGTTAYNI